MRLLELAADEIATGYYDPSEDRLHRRAPNDTRRPRLRLRDVNRLKRMRAMRQLETLKRQDLLGVMYGTPAEDAGGGMMPGGF